MKRILLFGLIAVLPAAAQWRRFGSEPTRVTGFAGIGLTVPANPLARQVDTGWNFSGGVGVTSRYVGVMFDAMFSDLGINHQTLQQIGVPNGNQRYWGFTVDPVFHVNQRGPVDFYITGGPGIYAQTTQFRTSYGDGGPLSGRGEVFYSNTIFKPGVDGGAGFAFNLSRRSHVKIFTEARFHHMFMRGPEANFIPVTLGVTF